MRWRSDSPSAALPVAERRRLRVRNNLQRLHPEWELPRLNRAVRSVFEETARYYVDLALLPSLTPKQILDDRLTLRGLEHLQAEIAAGAAWSRHRRTCPTPRRWCERSGRSRSRLRR